MNGDMLFDALTEIDDELIENAYAYRPHTKFQFQWRYFSAAAAVVVFLSAGFFGYRIMSSMNGAKSESTSTCVTNMTGAAAAQDAAAAENEMARPEQVKGGAAENSLELATEKKLYIFAGELDGYGVCYEEIAEDEYIIYIAAGDELYTLEESALSKEQKLAAEKMVEEKLKQKKEKEE